MTNHSTEETNEDRNNYKVLSKQLKFPQVFIHLQQTLFQVITKKKKRLNLTSIENIIFHVVTLGIYLGIGVSVSRISISH